MKNFEFQLITLKKTLSLNTIVLSASMRFNHRILVFIDRLLRPKVNVNARLCISQNGRPQNKECVFEIIFLISHSKHVLWVLKRTVSMRRFF